jgi:hypothetical protein
MFAVRNLFTPWRVLIATVVICAAAQPARADLFLSIMNDNGPGSKTIDLTTSGLTGTTSVGGYTFGYTASSTSSASGATIDLSKLTVTSPSTATSSTTGKFDVSLYTATNSSGSTSSGVFTTPVTSTGGNIMLTNTSTISTPSGVTGSLSSSGSYTAYNGTTVGGIDTEPTGTSSTSIANKHGGSGSLTNVANYPQVSGTSSYDLTSSATVSITGKGTGTFSNKTTVSALPEPSGVAAMMAGLPCLGLLAGFARRRRLEANPVSAA